MARNRGVEPSAITQLKLWRYLLLKTHIKASASQVMQDNICVIFVFVCLSYGLKLLKEIIRLKVATTKNKTKKVL